MAGRLEPEPVKQLAVIDDEVPEIVDLVRRLGIAWRRAGMARRVDLVALGEPRDELAVRAQAPWPVETDERRAAAAHLDGGFDLALPEAEPLLFDRHVRTRRRRPSRRRGSFS